MKLTFELMQQLHRGEITPAEAFKRAGGTCPDPEVAQFQSMPCEQLAARLDAARGDIRDNGPDALRDGPEAPLEQVPARRSLPLHPRPARRCPSRGQ
jgi:hypothetical protein